ncbi:MAG: hypothetical protein COW00_11075 [Bdellovibrio sp. CG12_big_fil_rev_8_21_14_0_65_39_13]|nr:MAG: hypothetical protein COW78_16430 [Bdellovibrio sp. CG22_combo_CG10-13_8_21_14_all_39_27]PIQ59263.1 MAG: hypothetical protein COW00_11075 [Bdellovibrio sp. CG12_big_fil_rev_8_21_14_0_65_39_13]PIR32274.1 MAG: hypothetical protein COV37_20365 [Bdellovibrio sp. CG11_big_fil_rev_8_21_14_0_20_39_38]
MENPYDMSTQYNDLLRDVPVNPQDMERGIAFLKEKMDMSNSEKEKAKMLNLVGVYLRIVGKLEEAELMLADSHTIYTNLKEMVLAEGVALRLAIVHQYMGDFNKADAVFTRIIKEVEQNHNRELAVFHDFALQHYAKSLFEQKRYQKALDLLLKVHGMRLLKGDMHLIESTEIAIQKTRQMMEQEN